MDISSDDVTGFQQVYPGSHPNGVRKPQSSRRNFGCSKPLKSAEKAWLHFGRPEAVTNPGGEYARVDSNSSDAIFCRSQNRYDHGRTSRTIAAGPA